MIANLFPFHGFIWGVATGVVLIIIGVAIWNWRHPE